MSEEEREKLMRFSSSIGIIEKNVSIHCTFACLATQTRKNHVEVQLVTLIVELHSLVGTYYILL